MRSTVYDRAKQTGFLTSPDHPLARTIAPAKAAPSGAALRSALVSAAGGTPGSPAEPPPGEDEEIPSEMPPASDDEPLADDAAAADAAPHGTASKPLDLVNGKAVIRLDDGQMFELRMLQQPSEESAATAGSPARSMGAILGAGGGY